MSPVRADYVRPLDFKHGRVDMTHGSGGRAMAQLIDELFLHAFDNAWLRQGNDAARVSMPHGRVVMATDAHVVSPLFFPGGDIGSLSVHGTINDVAMMGAAPLYLAAWEEMAKPQANPGEVTRLFDEVADKRQESQREGITQMLQFMSTLSPDQRRKFVTLMRERWGSRRSR